MSNLSYHQPSVPLGPNKLLLRTISGHKSYVTSVAFFGPLCDRIITGSYDELAKVISFAWMKVLRSLTQRRWKLLGWMSLRVSIQDHPTEKLSMDTYEDTWYDYEHDICCAISSRRTSAHREVDTHTSHSVLLLTCCFRSAATIDTSTAHLFLRGKDGATHERNLIILPVGVPCGWAFLAFATNGGILSYHWRQLLFGKVYTSSAHVV